MWWVVALLLCWTSVSHAEESPRLTDRGRFMPAGSVGGYWSNDEDSPGLTSYRTSEVWIQPWLGYFFWDRVGFGIYGGFSSWREPSGVYELRSRDVSAGLSWLGELPLGPRLGLLMVVHLGYGHEWIRAGQDRAPPASTSAPGVFTEQPSPYDALLNQERHRFELGAQLPLLVHVSSSVALGGGPSLRWARYRWSDDYPRRGGNTPLRIGLSAFFGCSF